MVVAIATWVGVVGGSAGAISDEATFARCSVPSLFVATSARFDEPDDRNSRLIRRPNTMPLANTEIVRPVIHHGRGVSGFTVRWRAVGGGSG